MQYNHRNRRRLKRTTAVNAPVVPVAGAPVAQPVTEPSTANTDSPPSNDRGQTR